MQITRNIDNRIKNNGFTLIEIMLGVLIFSIIIIGGFKAYSGVLIGKIKLIESTDIQKEAFYFSEKFFEEVKKGGTIDYEEYFNRTVVGTGLTNGHFDTLTGFGNYGTHYLCRSGNSILMGTGGCVTGSNASSSTDITGTSTDYTNQQHRYGQYAAQFIDYNSNYNADFGDEDSDSDIIGDDDDEYLGEGPDAFDNGEVKEIYLISADKKNRTLFRWNIQDDPFDPNNNCNFTTGSGGCLSTIEFLKLEGRDWGYDHDTSNGNDEGEYDGIIDTWLIDKDFSGETNIDFTNSVVAGSSPTSDNWEPLFGESINVTNVKFFAYPNKDLELAWKDAGHEVNIAPYIRIQMTLSPSYNARKGIKGSIPKININTTISLTDIYSR